MVLVCTVLGGFLSFADEFPRRPFPQHVDYLPESIRPSLPQEILDAQVAAYYRRWKARYLWTVPNTDPPQKLVRIDLNAPWVDPEVATVSEAHGYGMLILATMAGYDPEAKRDFDAMFRLFAAHRSAGNPNFMCWELRFVRKGGRIVGVRNTSEGPYSATDGDMDIAYALLLADRQWGSSGPIDYRAEALKIIRALMEDVVSKDQWVLQLGDWVKTAPRWRNVVRTSDFMLHHIRAFSQADVDNREKWLRVYERTLGIIQEVHERWTPGTGLLPDFLELRGGEYVPAVGRVLETENDGDYGYNACRAPWRLGAAHLLLGEERLRGILSALNAWIREETGGDPLRIRPGYYIRNGPEGTPIPREWEGADMSFIAPFGVSACVDVGNREWLDRLWACITAESWDRGIPFSAATYYPNTIRMICMLIISRNWWFPGDI